MSETQSPTDTWRIEGALTLYTVEALRPQMVERIGHAVTWDLSGVDACDSAGLQLLCSARKSAGATGATLHMTNPASAIVTAAEGIGLDLTEITN